MRAHIVKSLITYLLRGIDMVEERMFEVLSDILITYVTTIKRAYDLDEEETLRMIEVMRLRFQNNSSA